MTAISQCRMAFENSYTDSRWMERDGEGYKRNGVDYDWERWKRAWIASRSQCAALTWRWNDSGSRLEANSRFHDDGFALYYRVQEDSEDVWLATFEGAVVSRGSLTECLVACSNHEDESH